MDSFSRATSNFYMLDFKKTASPLLGDRPGKSVYEETIYFCPKTGVVLLYSYVQKAVIKETEVALKIVYTKGLK